jgi:hypothetical protein
MNMPGFNAEMSLCRASPPMRPFETNQPHQDRAIYPALLANEGSFPRGPDSRPFVPCSDCRFMLESDLFTCDFLDDTSPKKPSKWRRQCIREAVARYDECMKRCY